MIKNLLTSFAAVCVLLMALSLSSSAQDYQKSIGVRLGLSNGITYKQFVSQSNAIEIMGSALFVSGNALSGNSAYVGLSGE
jgi:hypothetical protein